MEGCRGGVNGAAGLDWPRDLTRASRSLPTRMGIWQVQDGTVSVGNKRLGRHGVLVSNLCLGTMNFGWHTSEDDAHAIMDRALELGINFFDTADVYGWTVEHGLTEEIIGRWFARGGGRRDAVVLATKVYNPVDRKTDLPEVNSDGTSLSAYKIRKHCEGSLKRLQTDYVDLYQMHHVDRDLSLGRDLAGLRRSGAAGEGRLRRLEQLRGMGHRRRAARRRRGAASWGW